MITLAKARGGLMRHFLWLIAAVVSFSGLNAQRLMSLYDQAFIYEKEEHEELTLLAEKAAQDAEVDLTILTYQEEESANRATAFWKERSDDDGIAKLLILVKKMEVSEIRIELIKGPRESHSVSLRNELDDLTERVNMSSGHSVDSMKRFLGDMPAPFKHARAESVKNQENVVELDQLDKFRRVLPLREIKIGALIVLGFVTVVMILIGVCYVWLLIRRTRPYRFPTYEHKERLGGRNAGGGAILFEKEEWEA